MTGHDRTGHDRRGEARVTDADPSVADLQCSGGERYGIGWTTGRRKGETSGKGRKACTKRKCVISSTKRGDRSKETIFFWHRFGEGGRGAGSSARSRPVFRVYGRWSGGSGGTGLGGRAARLYLGRVFGDVSGGVDGRRDGGKRSAVGWKGEFVGFRATRAIEAHRSAGRWPSDERACVASLVSLERRGIGGDVGTVELEIRCARQAFRGEEGRRQTQVARASAVRATMPAVSSITSARERRI